MNRIINGISKAQERIESKNLSAEKIESMRKSMDMELDEYCKFQEMKTVAVGSRLTLEEAQTIYAYLGNTPEHFNSQSLAVKYVLTEVFGSLIKAHIASKVKQPMFVEA